jgi:NADPH-dependent dioxygenase
VALLPQCELEELLEHRLGVLGVQVEWGNRLTDLEQTGDQVLATLAELTSTGKGYAVPHVDEIVRRTVQIGAKYLVGADGRDSHVRELLGIRQKQFSPGTCYHMFEITAERDFPEEIRMAFDDATLNLFTPLTERRCRFVFQVPDEDVPYQAYLKDRTHFRIVDARGAAMKLFEDLCATHAPWFDAGVENIEWHGTIPFGATLATTLLRHHCCLAGDAAHLNSPLGMQSMNLGICEGITLSRSLASILRGGASPDLLREYDEDTRAEWEALLNAEVQLSAEYIRSAGPAAKALVCALPGTGEDLSALLGQVGIRFEPHAKRRHSVAVR